VGFGTFEAWRERAGSLAALEASDGTNLTLTGFGAAERVSAINVTPGFLTPLGVTPALGRPFQLDDVGPQVVIVSNAFWRGKLAADPNAIGRPPSLVRAAHPTDAGREAVVRTAGTGYFDVMQIPVVAGRSFERGDNSSAPVRVVVSELLAERLFGSGQAVGCRIWLAATSQAAEIIGVVGVPAAIVTVAGVGAVLPAARRAARTDPLVALRAE
jgi:hypothetical protein